MSQQNHPTIATAAASPMRRTVAISLAFILALTIVAYFSWRLITQQQESELLSWQNRLAIIAESRTERVQSWLDEHFTALQRLSEQDPVNLYVDSLLQGTLPQNEALLIQKRYLENFLAATAAQADFLPTRPSAKVDANIPRTGNAGLAIIAPDGRIIAATPDMPPLDVAWRGFLAESKDKPQKLRGIYRGPTGLPSIGFVVPLHSGKVGGPTETNAYVIGIKPVEDAFFGLLRQPGNISASLEAYLVRRAAEAVQYLSPLRDGTPPLALIEDINTPDLAAALAIRHPGKFTLARDYRGKAVFVTGRQILGGQWTLVQSILREEALADSDARLRRDLAIVALCIILLAGAAILIWRQAISSRLQTALEKNRKIMTDLAIEERLLRSVTDSVSDDIFILDEVGMLKFSNGALSRRLDVPRDALVGKPLANILGPDMAAHYLDLVKASSLTGKRASVEWNPPDRPTRTLRTTLIPLGSSQGAEIRYLILDSDITDVVTEREQQTRLLSNLIDGIVAMVDVRDPRAKGQSVQVAEVAASLGKEMDLDRGTQSRVKMAARLVNFYKMLVPVDILTQSAALNKENYRLIDAAKKQSVHFLSQIPEMQPVCQILGELDEWHDGSGPTGLQGDAIGLPTQVVSLANVFIALITQRAYRDRLSTTEAMAQIENLSGRRFSPKVVAAFMNYMENHGGRMRWTSP